MIDLNHVRLSDMHHAANANACCPGSACEFPSNRGEEQEHIDVSPPAEAAGNFLKFFEAASSIKCQADEEKGSRKLFEATKKILDKIQKDKKSSQSKLDEQYIRWNLQLEAPSLVVNH